MDLVNRLEGRLLFAVPKKGRLNQPTLSLLEGADIQFKREHRLDIALVKNLPIALVFLPAADIPTFVGEGRVDLGITGFDQLEEHTVASQVYDECLPADSVKAHVGNGHKHPGTCEIVMDLGFGSCELQLQAPEKGPYQAPADLVGRNIGTSFVHLAEQYFRHLESSPANGVNGTHTNGSGESLQKKPSIKTKIIEISGSVEAACALGVADGVLDLVESGETMRAAGLKSIATVLKSNAVLISSKSPSDPQLVELIAARIRGVITKQKYVLCQYNIERNSLAAANKIAPGKRTPTVVSLEDGGWVAVSVMVKIEDIAVIMDQLTALGASDVLVLQIANTRS